MKPDLSHSSWCELLVTVKEYRIVRSMMLHGFYEQRDRLHEIEQRMFFLLDCIELGYTRQQMLAHARRLASQLARVQTDSHIKEVPVLRAVATTRARVLNVANATDPQAPGARGVVTLEQTDADHKGSFKVMLPATECCNLESGGEVEIELKRRVQDGQRF